MSLLIAIVTMSNFATIIEVKIKNQDVNFFSGLRDKFQENAIKGAFDKAKNHDFTIKDMDIEFDYESDDYGFSIEHFVHFTFYMQWDDNDESYVFFSMPINDFMTIVHDNFLL